LTITWGISEEDLLESAADAASQLQTYRFKEKVLCLREIEDYYVHIPSDYYDIQAVLYTDAYPEEDIQKAIETTTVNLCESEVTKKNVTTLLETDFLNGWQWMNMGHSIKTMLDQCDTDVKPPLGRSCNLTYSVNGNIITTSCRDGFVIIIYRRAIRDTDGHPMIPATQNVKEAIKAFVLMEYFERNMIHDDQGALGKFRIYAQRWENLAAAAVGDLMNVTLPEWVEVVKTNRFFKDDSPYRHFDTMGFERTNIGL
jgi:hypothetical protein